MRFFLFCSALIFCFTLLLPSESSSQWLQTNGPYGGEIVSLAVSGTTVYAGTSRGGVFRSPDNGRSWEHIGLDELAWIPSICVNGSHVYAINFRDYYKGPVYEYSGSGTTWSEVAWDLPQGTLFTFVKKIGSTMFAATEPGLYRSTDNGAHWTAADSGLSVDAKIVVDIAAAGKYLFAATYNGIYRSADGGTTWAASSAGLSVSHVKSLAAIDTVIYAAGDSYFGVYRSSDYGETWTKSRKGLEDASIINSLAVIDTTLFVGALGGVFRSTDKGETWTRKTDGMTNTYVNVLAAAGTSLFAGTSGGAVFYSADKGSSWSSSDAGIVNTTITALWAEDSVVIAGLYPYSIVRSHDEGATWSSVGPARALAASFARCGEEIFMAAVSGLFRSPDDGKSWVQADTSIRGLALAASDSVLVVGGFDSVWISADYGKTWSASNLAFIKSNVNAVAVMNGNIFAGTDAGIYLSSDGGLHWGKITSLTYIQTLAVRDSVLYAGAATSGANRIYQAAGGAWKSTSLGLSEASTFAVVGARLFVGRYLDVMSCSLDRWHWDWGSPNLDRVLTSISATDRYLYAGTQGGGVFKLEISRVLGVEGNEKTEVPEGFRLGQNYPNPFNPSTRIEFDVPERGFVRLTVFDVMGREVARLVEGELGAGKYVRGWNAAGRASGVFYYRLQAGGRVETKKMMLVK